MGTDIPAATIHIIHARSDLCVVRAAGRLFVQSPRRCPCSSLLSCLSALNSDHRPSIMTRAGSAVEGTANARFPLLPLTPSSSPGLGEIYKFIFCKNKFGLFSPGSAHPSRLRVQVIERPCALRGIRSFVSACTLLVNIRNLRIRVR